MVWPDIIYKDTNCRKAVNPEELLSVLLNFVPTGKLTNFLAETAFALGNAKQCYKKTSQHMYPAFLYGDECIKINSPMCSSSMVCKDNVDLYKYLFIYLFIYLNLRIATYFTCLQASPRYQCTAKTAFPNRWWAVSSSGRLGPSFDA